MIQKRAAFVYRVETVCAATIREVWTVRSRAALTADQLADLLAQPVPPGEARPTPGLTAVVITACEDETRVTEAGRAVVDVLRVDAGAVERS